MKYDKLTGEQLKVLANMPHGSIPLMYSISIQSMAQELIEIREWLKEECCGWEYYQYSIGEHENEV